jgi:hypothetical protein
MAKEGKVELEIHEITKCPFKGVAATDPMTSLGLEGDDGVVCRKMVNGQMVGGGRIVRGPCVGEENCPDMQTHMAVIKILKLLGERDKKNQLPRGCTGGEIDD